MWGCSYSGALSAWFRLKFPQLVIGSVAPSGPVYATPNFDGYYALFQKIADPACVQAVTSGVQQILTALQSQTGRAMLKVTFKSLNNTNL